MLYCSLKCHEWIKYEPKKPKEKRKEKFHSKAEKDAFFEKWRAAKRKKKERLKEEARIKEERKGEPGFDSDGDPIEGTGAIGDVFGDSIEDGDGDRDIKNEHDDMSDDHDAGWDDDETDSDDANTEHIVRIKREKSSDKESDEDDDDEEDDGGVDLEQFEADKDGNYNFDGYDTDEMRELLQSLRSGHKPPRKKRKVDPRVPTYNKPISKALRKVIPKKEQKEMENRKREWFDDDDDENWDESD